MIESFGKMINDQRDGNCLTIYREMNLAYGKKNEKNNFWEVKAILKSSHSAALLKTLGFVLIVY